MKEKSSLFITAIIGIVAVVTMTLLAINVMPKETVLSSTGVDHSGAVIRVADGAPQPIPTSTQKPTSVIKPTPTQPCVCNKVCTPIQNCGYNITNTTQMFKAGSLYRSIDLGSNISNHCLYGLTIANNTGTVIDGPVRTVTTRSAVSVTTGNVVLCGSQDCILLNIGECRYIQTNPPNQTYETSRLAYYDNIDPVSTSIVYGPLQSQKISTPQCTNSKVQYTADGLAQFYKSCTATTTQLTCETTGTACGNQCTGSCATIQ
jgi:hypothetical protein